MAEAVSSSFSLSPVARRSLAIFAICLGAGVLNSCGSGAVSSSSSPDIAFSVSPASTTSYSGVPVTFTISGGGLRGPYQVTSSNASLLPVPPGTISATQFSLTPSVVASSQSVTITVRDQAGALATASTTITPNFIGGDITVTGTGPATTGLAACQSTGVVCAGQTGTVKLTVSSLGAPAAGRAVRFDVVQGAYRFPTNAAQTTFATSITVTSDERGVASTPLLADTSVPFQVATIRATDVASGAFRTSTFFIRQPTVAGAEFTTVPTQWTVSGTYKTECPGGVVDYLIFGGTPPYTIRSSVPGFANIFPSVTNVENPSRFTVTFGASTCAADSSVVFTVTDATGLTTLPTLTVKPGTEDRPAPPPTMTLSPTTLTVGCGQQGQSLATVLTTASTTPVVTASLGTAVNPSNALLVTVAASGGLITVTRNNGTVASSPAVITVGSGVTAPQTLSVVTPLTCP